MEGAAESYPLPEDPALADVARALRDAGHWGWVVDDQWRFAYATDELRLTFGGGELASFPLGRHAAGPELIRASADWAFGANTAEIYRANCAGLIPMMLADTPGGSEQLRAS